MLVCILSFVKAMEDHKDEFILILAGYPNEMDFFLRTNPGLQSRFPIHLDFPDYTQDELLKIAELICVTRQYELAESTKLALLAMLARALSGAEHFGNARTVRNIIEKAIRHQAVRLFKQPTFTRKELLLLEPADLREVGLCKNV
ncbi:AAA family ATPase [Pelorhabdus rhamnosifermentans]|uniref:AAA family ATPase n=1 Tax=Pelorhabdus rhamnosifermentans TaxID=2772457 RepID=UPI001FEC322F|nr:AAA family ATPase [Pelorhabdus rhamnosifermentans]